MTGGSQTATKNEKKKHFVFFFLFLFLTKYGDYDSSDPDEQLVMPLLYLNLCIGIFLFEFPRSFPNLPGVNFGVTNSFIRVSI